MSELPEIVPKPTPVAKEQRCAAGPCAKTILCFPVRYGKVPFFRKVSPAQITDEPAILDDVAFVAGRTLAKHNTRREFIRSCNGDGIQRGSNSRP